MIKDDQFRDNPPRIETDYGKEKGASESQLRIYNENRPELHGILRDMRALVDIPRSKSVSLAVSVAAC